MGACLATQPHHATSPRRVAPNFVPPATNRDNTNVYQATPSPQRVEVIYTDDTRKKLSLNEKLKGNEHFSNKEYLLAAESYTKAIKIYDNDPVYFSNRALCYAFLTRYEEALADAEMSIKLDPKNYKSYHVKGITLVEIGKREESTEKMREGLEYLQKSLEMVKESQAGKRAIAQLEAKVNRANKIIYLKEHGEQLQKQNQTKLFVEQLIAKDKTQSEEEKKITKELFSSFINEREDHKAQEVPETLTCKITFDLMIEPVISSSGITYEKEALMGHLTKVGFFDPSTRQPVNPYNLIPNNQLLQAIKDFQNKNPWSFEFISPNEDYHAISM